VSRTRVKICGITRPEDGLMAARAGADAIGLVFYPPSPRAVSLAQASVIRQALPPFVSVVGLFVDADSGFVAEARQQLSLDILQFHGNEPVAYCEQFSAPYLKAIRMKEDLDVAATIAGYASASGVLLDAYRKGVPGGTGECFDWQRVPSQAALPVVLAGGLNPDNAAEAVTQVAPWSVDVSGGVESSPGIKDHARVAAFIDAVNKVQK